MLDVKPLCQRSEIWKDHLLGFGTGSIGSYGCLLVSYTMILNYFTKRNFTPLDVNEAMKRAGGYSGVSKNLWMWYVADNIYPTKYTISSGNVYDNNGVLSWISKGIPVIVKVDGKPIGGLSHYVVALGDGKIADPFTGKIEPFSKYTPLGYHVYTYTGEDIIGDTNMSDIYKGLDLNNKESMKVAVDMWYDVVKAGLYLKISQIDENYVRKSFVDDLNKEINNLQKELKDSEGMIIDLEKEIVENNKLIKEKNLIIQDLKKEIAEPLSEEEIEKQKQENRKTVLDQTGIIDFISYKLFRR